MTLLTAWRVPRDIRQHAVVGGSQLPVGCAHSGSGPCPLMKNSELVAKLAPMLAMAVAAAVGKLHTTFVRSAAEVQSLPSYEAVGANVISNSTPVALTIERVLSGEEAAHIIELARPRMQRGQVFEHHQEWLPAISLPPAGPRKARIAGRTNTLAWLQHDETPVVRKVVERISKMVGIPSAHAEKMQVIRYENGQEYKTHVDGYEDASNYQGGQRLVTALAYLTTVPEEGGAATKVGDHEIQPETGRLLVFHNCIGKTNELDRSAAHAGMPVLGAQEKWALNLWYHEYPAV